MRQVSLEGPGHYLGHEQTLGLMQTEYVYPNIADRSSPKEWLELGKPDILQRAIERKREILDNHHPGHLTPDIDAIIRDKFDIRLAKADMG